MGPDKEPRRMLDMLKQGSKIEFVLAGGQRASGIFEGRDGDEIRLSGRAIPLREIESVAMRISSEGPE